MPYFPYPHTASQKTFPTSVFLFELSYFCYFVHMMETSYTSFPAFKPTRRTSIAQSVKNSFSATLPTYLVPAQSNSSQPSTKPYSSHRHHQSR